MANSNYRRAMVINSWFFFSGFSKCKTLD